MHTVFLSCGSNLGDRHTNITAILDHLKAVLSPLERISPLMETMPVGDGLGDQSWFLNCIVTGQYDGTPQQLLDLCKSIETTLGRQPDSHNQPRTADIDILLFDNQVVNSPDLIIPHPRICERRFCLEGLMSLAPDLIIPPTSASVRSFYLAMPTHINAQTINFIQ